MIELFSKFGPVLDAEIIFNSRGSKGFGFVTMARREDGWVALDRLHNSKVDGRIIDINLAHPKKSALVRFSIIDLLEAEVRLAQAEVEVERLRRELC